MPDSSLNRGVTQVLFSQGAAGQLDLVTAPGTGGKVYITTLVFTMTLGGTIVFQEGTGPTNLTGVMTFPTGGGLQLNGSMSEPVIQCNTAATKFSLTTVTGGAMGYIRYYIAP
jgi:hypothetical protein